MMIMIVIALLGGIARQAHQWLTGKARPGWKHFLMRAIISVFIGVVCFYMLPRSSAWTGAITGLLSWLGADGITLLIELLIKTKHGAEKE
jgi:uncharacterized membrane protein HdeD (DUF308 family)